MKDPTGDAGQAQILISKHPELKALVIKLTGLHYHITKKHSRTSKRFIETWQHLDFAKKLV